MAYKQTSDMNGKLPCITWCPTGPLVFLPIHAAGMYPPQNGCAETVMDFAVSSYTPTLETLLRHHGRKPSSTRPTSPSPAEPTFRQQPSIFVVAQPNTPNYAPIPGTRAEAKSINDVFNQSIDILEGRQGTVDAVLNGMRTHDWVHLACHGTQSTEDPTKSCFVLDDGELTLSKLMETSLPNAELAVLLPDCHRRREVDGRGSPPCSRDAHSWIQERHRDDVVYQRRKRTCRDEEVLRGYGRASRCGWAVGASVCSSRGDEGAAREIRRG